MFLILTIPLARLVDRLIAKQQARTGRGRPVPVAGPPSAPTTATT
jgi:hypothetical protein